MPSNHWTDAFLDQMRLQGDPLADQVVAQLYAENKVTAVNDLMRTLIVNDGVPPAKLPSVIQDYLARTDAEAPAMDLEKIRRGEDLFGTYGPEILMVLGFYSLPASYAAKKGVQVLYRTAYLEKRPIRRVIETAQMVVDVMDRGGLEPGGRGVRSAQKVRLMHAAVRYLAQHQPGQPWDHASLGLPINQEDLAGTLMTFSYVVIEGLARLNIHLSAEEQEAYLHAWLAVGHLLGLRPEVMPKDVAQAKELTYTIRRRQIGPSPEGHKLTAALLEGMEKLTPALLHGLPASMVHFFFDKDLFMGLNVADLLGVPPPNWLELLTRAMTEVTGLVQWLGESRQTEKVYRFLARRLVEGLILVERGGERVPFYIPTQLQDDWELKPASAAKAGSPSPGRARSTP